jgi:diketogulonate reductase-like aldo/keto reductase
MSSLSLEGKSHDPQVFLPCNEKRLLIHLDPRSRKVKHLQDNIKSLDIKLSTEDIDYLESIVSFEPGFPNNFVGPDPHYGGKPGMFVAGVAPMAYVQRDKPIGHE